MLANFRNDMGHSFATALVVDDHPLFCEALAMTLRAMLGVRDVSVASSLEGALGEIAGGARPDIVLLDLNLPDVSGLDGLLRLKTALVDTPILIVSSISDQKIIDMAIKAGASGYVPKHSQAEAFRAAFEAVATGDAYTPTGVMRPSPVENGSDDADVLTRLSSLTLQQARILNLVCEGKLNKQIAYDLSIAETTVKAHMTAILRKLGVQSRTQAVLIAQRANFAKLLQDSASSA